MFPICLCKDPTTLLRIVGQDERDIEGDEGEELELENPKSRLRGLQGSLHSPQTFFLQSADIFPNFFFK